MPLIFRPIRKRLLYSSIPRSPTESRPLPEAFLTLLRVSMPKNRDQMCIGQTLSTSRHTSLCILSDRIMSTKNDFYQRCCVKSPHFIKFPSDYPSKNPTFVCQRSCQEVSQYLIVSLIPQFSPNKYLSSCILFSAKPWWDVAVEQLPLNTVGATAASMADHV